MLKTYLKSEAVLALRKFYQKKRTRARQRHEVLLWTDFEHFLRTVGLRPSNTHWLVKVDDNQPLGPDNWCWKSTGDYLVTTKTDKARQPHSTALTIEYEGETLTLAEWAQRYSIPVTTLRRRLQNKWPIADALKQPVEKRTPTHQSVITYQGRTQNLRQWSIELGIEYHALYYRIIKSKWSVEKAFTTPIR